MSAPHTEIEAVSETRPPLPVIEHKRAQWGMLLFITTEAMLFILLFFSYFYLSAKSPEWPPKELPELPLPLIMSVFLISSSFVLYWGEQGIKRGDNGRLLRGLLITMLLGVVFLSIQFFEFREHLRTEKPGSSAYASIFYTTTSFHAAHVFMGLLMLGFIAVRAYLAHFDEQRHAPVSSVSLYWHFVDLVWVFILAILYLSPRITR